MKIGMLTWGSHGDIRPFLALATGLQQAGHEVHLVITCLNSAFYRQLEDSAAPRITVLAPMELSAEEEAALGQRVYRIRNPMTQLGVLGRVTAGRAAPSYCRARPAARRCSSLAE